MIYERIAPVQSVLPPVENGALHDLSGKIPPSGGCWRSLCGAVRAVQPPDINRFSKQAVDLAEQRLDVRHFDVCIEIRMALPALVEDEDARIAGVETIDETTQAVR